MKIEIAPSKDVYIQSIDIDSLYVMYSRRPKCFICSQFVVTSPWLFYSRRETWEDNLAYITSHNQEADMGIHSYTLDMNTFGDKVCADRGL